MMYQSIKVSYPKSHGNAPKVASRPSAPKKRVVVSTKSNKNNTSYAKR